jgi:hypothetical protein
MWKSPPTVKSLYTSIEFLYGFTYKGAVNRVNRFIKLYPEAGVFQDKVKVDVTSTSNPLILHYSYVGKDDKAVCLLELSSTIISPIADSSSNTLMVWIYYGTLLETDYDDASSTYPAAPVLSSINAYGVQNGVPQSKENLYYLTSPAVSPFTGDAGILDTLTRNPGVDSLTLDQYSQYSLFMGSWIAFTGSSSGNITGTDSTNRLPLLIPFYCPFKDESTNLVFNSTRLPAVMVTWMNMSSHTSFTVQKFVGYSHTNNTGTGRKKTTLVLNRTQILSIYLYCYQC